MGWAELELTGWGRVHKARCVAARPERWRDFRILASARADVPMVARGAGRSYGDAALLSGGRVLITTRLDRLLALDTATGSLVAEAGASFADMLRTLLPHGFVPPVMPGTGFATLGGGIACDVHGKNHHRDGSLGRHVEWMELRLPSGELRRVSRSADESLFRATLGGLGQTGVVERAALRLKKVPSNALVVRKRRIPDLDGFLAAFEDEHACSDYVVGWIDALARGARLGQGILETANPAPDNVAETIRRARRLPFEFPAFALNRFSVAAFNAAYSRHVPVSGSERVQTYARFLFPLDALHEWNRLYGRRGFFQFQCVLPHGDGGRALRSILEVIGRSGRASFLAVLKALGDPGEGYLSFPMRGYTLALDFPNAPGVLELVRALERLTADAGGRVYLAKDATLEAQLFPGMYPQLERFRAIAETVDPQRRLSSDLARRLRLVT